MGTLFIIMSIVFFKICAKHQNHTDLGTGYAHTHIQQKKLYIKYLVFLVMDINENYKVIQANKYIK